jgi:folate-dependent tRNA-U54 methylase TrmFO/GidA
LTILATGPLTSDALSAEFDRFLDALLKAQAAET